LLPPIIEKALLPHGVIPSEVEWYHARTGSEAISFCTKVNSANINWMRGYRGFDAVFCDLKIPWTNEAPQVAIGFEVARRIAGFGWPCPVIALSVWSGENTTLATRREQLETSLLSGETPIFDDFLLKDFGSHEYVERILPKLTQMLVP
jgi:hypothetical protein